MVCKKYFSLSLFFFTLSLSSFLYSADSWKNVDILVSESNGKWTGQLPNGSSTELVAPSAMPKGPEVNPTQVEMVIEKKNTSFFGGIVNFFIDLGRPNKAQSERAFKLKMAEKIAENKTRVLAAGKEVFEQFYPEDCAKMQVAEQAAQFAQMAKKGTQVFTAEANFVGSTSTVVAAPTATSPTQTPFATLATALNAAPTETLTEISGPNPQLPTILADNPLKGFPKEFSKLRGYSPHSGDGGAGGVAQGAGAVAAATGMAANTVTATTVTTTGGATAAGAGAGSATTVTTTATIGSYVWPAVVVVGNACAVAVILYGTYKLGASIWNEWKADELRIPNPNHYYSGYKIDNPNPAPNPDPKKPDDEKKKERKFNHCQRTDAMKKIKKNYRYDKQSKVYVLKDNGKPIINTLTGKPVEIVYWDGLHGDIEAWRGLRQGQHLGSLDPKTFEMYKGPDLNRKLL